MLPFYLSIIDLPEDKRKFELLYEKYRIFMFRVAYNILKDPQAAEDAVHDAFVKVAMSIDSIEEIDSPRVKGYLIIITRNVSIDTYRKRKRVTLMDNLIEQPSDSSIDDQIMVDESYLNLIKVIKSLPGRYADVLLLRFYNNISVSQISNILNISEHNVRKTIDRARKALSVRLIEEEGESVGS